MPRSTRRKGREARAGGRPAPTPGTPALEGADRVDRMLRRLRNHPLLAVLIVAALIITGADQLAQAVTGRGLSALFARPDPPSARPDPPSARPDPPSVITSIVKPGSLEFLMPAPVEDLPPPGAPDCYSEEFIRWAGDRGGVSANKAFGNVSFEGRGDGTSLIRVEGILVEKRKAASVSGDYVNCPVGGGEDVPTATIDLDAKGAGVTYTNAQLDEISRPVFTLASGQRETLHLFVSTSKTSVVWSAELLLTVNGKPERVPLVDGEQQLQVASGPGRYWDGKGWVRN